MRRPERLQGTDGVRGAVIPFSQAPVDDFIDNGHISPEFVEIYSAAFITFLRRFLKKEQPVVAVGYDPRDPERMIIEPAMLGITKAGGQAVDIGILPTPAVPLYCIDQELDGGLMITASHNPADQNGIKLFMPGIGLKLFPHEDALLTETIYDLASGMKPQNGPAPKEDAGAARELFVQTMLAPKNSWMTEEFDRNSIALVVDAANGACAPVVRSIFDPLDIRMTEYVGMSQDGDVNDNCGAGLYEGVERITSDGEAGGGKNLRPVALVQSLFRHAHQHREELLAGEFRLCGCAFDGDGDRFYALEYDPQEDCLRVVSGDEISVHQARHMKRVNGESLQEIITAATTIESDISVTSAFENAGYIPVLSGVGDKWLLWEAQCNLFSSICDALEAEIEPIVDVEQVEQLRNRLEKMPEPSALALRVLLREAWELAEKHSIDVVSRLASYDSHGFIIGSEETGHSVTATFLEGKPPLYSGNGIKSALNYLAATNGAISRPPEGGEYASLHHPFESGIKATLPVYYTDKSRLAPGKESRTWLNDRIKEAVEAAIPESVHMLALQRPEEPDMLFFTLMQVNEAGEDSIAATIFCRNSGTEAKTSLYLRSIPEIAEPLRHALESAYPSILEVLIDRHNPHAAAQSAILAALKKNGALDHSQLPAMPEGVDLRRLLVEMTLKQGLLVTENGLIDLSERGKAVADQLG